MRMPYHCKAAGYRTSCAEEKGTLFYSERAVVRVIAFHSLTLGCSVYEEPYAITTEPCRSRTLEKEGERPKAAADATESTDGEQCFFKCEMDARYCNLKRSEKKG